MVRKVSILSLLLIISVLPVYSQQWQAEFMAGVSTYNGELSQKDFSLKTLGPSVNLNVKYMFPGNFVGIRAGLGYGRVSGSDKNNTKPGLRLRYLDFKTHILELSLIAELNLLDPETYDVYPFMFVGTGIFHFDPYTFDKNNQKTFLRSLGTEGQGLKEYPDRKMYSLTQFCIPFGGGLKWKMNELYEVSYEFGARYLLTDYLDDVSTSYAAQAPLKEERGRIAVELADRRTIPAIDGGGQRGNPKAKDWYYMTGLKITVNIGVPFE